MPREIHEPTPVDHWLRRIRSAGDYSLHLKVYPPILLGTAVLTGLMNPWPVNAVMASAFLGCIVVLVSFVFRPIRALLRTRRDRVALREGTWRGATRVAPDDPYAHRNPNRPEQNIVLDVAGVGRVTVHGGRGYRPARAVAVDDEIEVLCGRSGHCVIPSALGAVLGRDRDSVGREESDDDDARASVGPIFAPSGDSAPLVEELARTPERVTPGEVDVDGGSLRWDVDGAWHTDASGEARLEGGAIQLSLSGAGEERRLHAQLRDTSSGRRVALACDVMRDVDTTGVPRLDAGGATVSYADLEALLQALLAHGWTLARFVPASDEASVDDESTHAHLRRDPDDDASVDRATSHRRARLHQAGRSAMLLALAPLFVELVWIREPVSIGLTFAVVALIVGIVAMRLARRRPADSNARDARWWTGMPPQDLLWFGTSRGWIPPMTPGVAVGGGLVALYLSLVATFGAGSWLGPASTAVVWSVTVATRRNPAGSDVPRFPVTAPFLEALPTVVAWAAPALVVGIFGSVRGLPDALSVPWAVVLLSYPLAWNALLVAGIVFPYLMRTRDEGVTPLFWLPLWGTVATIVYSLKSSVIAFLLGLGGLFAAIAFSFNPLAGAVIGAGVGGVYGFFVAKAAGLIR